MPRRPTTPQEDQSFAEAFKQYANIDTGFILDWVEENFTPEEIYGEEGLKQHIQENYSPDDIFEDDELEKWAENADYVRPHDDYPEREL